MARTCIYSAIGTPLTESELHEEALAAHLEDQWDGEMDGILVAGTMGAMPLLTGNVYNQLIRTCATQSRRKGQVLVGVGDLSYARTLERIQIVNQYDVDGVVVLTPFFLLFTQQELISYYTSLAEQSRSPLFLYDLPQRTGTALEIETILRLARHPRIAGIKISGNVSKGRRILRELQEENFSIFFAEATALDLLILSGYKNHLDGIYCVVPRLARSIADAAESRQDKSNERHMGLLEALLAAIVKYGVFPAITTLLNHRGIAGNFAPAPFAPLDSQAREKLLSEPGVLESLRIG